MRLAIDIPAAMWLSSNGRQHRMAVASRTRDIRTLARLAARNHQPVPTPVVIGVAVGYPPTVHRADPPNAWPTIKAAIDGLVDAGLIDDDSSAHVDEHRFRRDPSKAKRGMYRLTFTITPIDQEAAA